MITLSYKLSEQWNEGVSGLDWARADEMTLRYGAFLGDQIFIVDRADFSALWGWVPILDFSASLLMLTTRLLEGQREVFFDFTESDAQLRFTRQGSNASISANYIDAQSTTPLANLRTAAVAYANTVYRDVTESHKELTTNPTFLQWFRLR